MNDFDVAETAVPVLKAADRLGPDLMMRLFGERVTARLLVRDPDPRWRRLLDVHRELLVFIRGELAADAIEVRTPFLDAWRDFVAKRRPRERI